VDGVYALLVPHALISPEKIARVIGESAKTSDKTILTCIMGDQSLGRSVNILDEYQVPMFTFPELGGKVFRSMLDYAHWKQNTEIFEEFTYTGAKDKVNQCLSNKKGVLQFGEYDTRPILEAYEIPVIPGALAKSPEETGEIAQMLGYPVVLKIASSDILHKSDYGGIRFNILSKEQAIEEASKLITDLHTKMPNAILDGILVEAMAPKGHEVIIGVKRDPNFGPLIMFGLGGIFVELFNDVSFGIAPLNRMIVMKMINKTKAGKVLKGLRGQESVNLDTIIDIILKLSQLAIDFPQINEIEINPLLALPSKVVALDARMIIRND